MNLDHRFVRVHNPNDRLDFAGRRREIPTPKPRDMAPSDEPPYPVATEDQAFALRDEWQKERRYEEMDEAERYYELKRNGAEAIEKGLAVVAAILERAQGKVLGASSEFRYQGGYTSSEIKTSKEAGAEEIAKMLARLGPYKYDYCLPLFDDTLLRVGESYGNGSRFRWVLGTETIAKDYANRDRGQDFFHVMDAEVLPEDYDSFIESVKSMVSAHLREKGLDNMEERDRLPNSWKKYVEATRKKYNMSMALQEAETVQPGKLTLKDHYGYSHFGSGGAYGSVRVYVLSDWRKGVITEKPVKEVEHFRNQFTAGVNAIEVEPNSIVVARGGDSIGERGRSWRESYICE